MTNRDNKRPVEKVLKRSVVPDFEILDVRDPAEMIFRFVLENQPVRVRQVVNHLKMGDKMARDNLRNLVKQGRLESKRQWIRLKEPEVKTVLADLYYCTSSQSGRK